MNIMLGNLKLEEIMNNEEKANELKLELEKLGYKNESNCQANDNTDRLTYHIYDLPRVMAFSVISNQVGDLLKSYSEYFKGSVQVSANKEV